jgi:hypothetical protein
VPYTSGTASFGLALPSIAWDQYLCADPKLLTSEVAGKNWNPPNLAVVWPRMSVLHMPRAVHWLMLPSQLV